MDIFGILDLDPDPHEKLDGSETLVITTTYLFIHRFKNHQVLPFPVISTVYFIRNKVQYVSCLFVSYYRMFFLQFFYEKVSERRKKLF